MRLALLLLALVVPLPGLAAGAATSIDELRKEIEALLAGHAARTPGASIAIVRREGPEWVAGIGLADVATKRPVTTDTLFRIGSTSKAFVALSILKLQHEGKLSLQDTLKSHAPDLEFSNPWEATDPVRIVHLLEHTSGWDDLALCEYGFDPPEEVSLREGLWLRPKTRTSRWKPGTRFSYSNAGPPAAAYVVEKITGERFEDYVERNWFRPLGMTTTSYFGTPEVRRHLTQLYREDGRTPYRYWKIVVRPSGSINASARDMANYVQFHLNRGEFGGTQLLPAAAFDRMETPTSTYAAREGLTVGYGLCNFTSFREGWRYHGHNGGVMGGLTEMAYQNDLGVGYCVMINSGNGRTLGEISRAIRNYLTRGAASPPKPAAARVPASLAREYSGWYVPIATRNQVTYFTDRLLRLGQLRVDATGLRWGREKYLAAGERLFRRDRDPQPTFALIADQSEGTLIHVGGGTYRRISAERVLAEFSAMGGAILLLAGSVIFAMFWLPRRFWGDLRGAPHLDIRIWPCFTALAGAAMILIILGASAEAIERLGRITPWSFSLFILTLAFPALAVWSLFVVWRARNAPVRRLVWWHSFTTALGAFGIAAYLAYWGIVGLRTWS